MSEIQSASGVAYTGPSAAARFGQEFMERVSPLVVVVGVVLGLLPLMVSNFYYLGLVVLMAVYTIVSMGNGILIGYAGQFTLGQGAVYAVGAYASAILTLTVGLPVWLSIIGATLVSGVVGMILGLPALRLRTHYLAMITLGFALVTPQLILSLENLTGGWIGISGIPKPSLGGQAVSRLGYYYVVLVATLLVLWVTYNVLRSRWRLAFLAIHDSELAASSLGISVYRTKLVAFLFASILTGFGGALYAHYLGFISPDNFSLEISIFFVLTIVIGGVTTLSGPLWGTIILVLLPEMLADMKTYSLVIYGLLLIVSQAFIPEGLVGAMLRLRDRLFPPKPGGAAKDSRADALDVPFRLYRSGRDAAGASEEVLRVEGITKHFGGVAALDQINFSVKAGSVHGLIGPNGSGKTTMLNIISGFYAPTGGKISFCGREKKNRQPDAIALAGIGRTLQTPKVFPQLTVLENVMAGLFTQERATLLEIMLRLPRTVAERRRSQERAEELLRFVGLYDRRHEMAKNLPHGQQRFLEIARALALEPALIMLDEPAAGLSGQEIDQLSELIMRIKETGCAVLLVEHHVEMVMQLADWLTVLEHGRKIAGGIPDDIRRSPVVIKAYLGVAS